MWRKWDRKAKTYRIKRLPWSTIQMRRGRERREFLWKSTIKKIKWDEIKKKKFFFTKICACEKSECRLFVYNSFSFFFFSFFIQTILSKHKKICAKHTHANQPTDRQADRPIQYEHFSDDVVFFHKYSFLRLSSVHSIVCLS